MGLLARFDLDGWRLPMEGKGAEGLQASAEGWKWLTDSLASIVFLKESFAAERDAKFPDELAGFQTCQRASMGTDPRLGAAVR